ncbi:MAG TPA: prepilin-type N-terminal cleavage/methylation domain-containing protein [Coriobacteriia bacterium]
MASNGRREDHGFSLIELMVIVFILGVLVLIAVASYRVSVDRSRAIACLYNQRLLDSAIPAYRASTGHDPSSLNDLRPYVRWPDPNFGKCAGNASVSLSYDATSAVVGCPVHPR